MITRHDLVDVQIHPHKYAHKANFKYFKQMEQYENTLKLQKSASNISRATGSSIAQASNKQRVVIQVANSNPPATLLPTEPSQRSRRVSFFADDPTVAEITSHAPEPHFESDSEVTVCFLSLKTLHLHLLQMK